MQAIRRLLPATLVATACIVGIAPPGRAETGSQTLASTPLAIPAQAPANPPSSTSPPTQAAPPQRSAPAPGSPLGSPDTPTRSGPSGGYQCERSRPTS